MHKTALIIISIFLAFAIIGTQSMKKTKEKPIVYTEDERAFIKECAIYRSVYKCEFSVKELRDMK